MPPNFFTVATWDDIRAVRYSVLFTEYEQAIVAKEHEPLSDEADERIAAMQAEILRRLRLYEKTTTGEI